MQMQCRRLLPPACWLLTYPLAGLLCAKAGLLVSSAMLASIAALAAGIGAWLWPASDLDGLANDLGREAVAGVAGNSRRCHPARLPR